MRIAHVTAVFPPYRSGTGNGCFYTARELARRGHDVTVFTAAVAGAPARETRDGFQIRRLRPLAQVGNASLLPQLLPVLRGFDVIHLHYPFISGAELVRLASLVHRVPFVMTLHNDLIGDGARALLFAGYQKASAWLTVRHAACLCAVSMDHYQSSRLRASVGNVRLTVVEIPNGVDTDRFCPGGESGIRDRYHVPEDAGLALFVAALDRAHHYKGLDRLLQAMVFLDEDAWLLVVGDGELRARYEEQARILGVAHRTVFAGGMPHDRLPPYFRAADVGVLPSCAPESFGMVLIEAMACGKPVVASESPGVRSVVSDGEDGLLVQPGDVAGLAAAVRALLADPGRRRVMGKSGRAKVEMKYTWQRVGVQLENIYRDILAPSPECLAARERSRE
jgi:glycosyltransferase involved in cell wall biosynthesis